MAKVSKSSLRKALTTTELVDPQGLTPYVALHLGEPGKCYVRRTGAIGFVATVGAPPLSDPGWAYVAYAHLQDCLKYIESDDVDILQLPNGGVVLKSLDAAFDTELRVHAVSRAQSAFKNHNPGDVFVELDPAWLQGLNTRAFPLATPPVIQGESLVLTTPYGVVRWGTTYDPQVPSSPRASFLRAVSGEEGVRIALTQQGYYRAYLDDMEVYTGGHQASLAPSPLLGDALPGVVLPAARLVQSLRHACGIAGPATWVVLSAKAGVTTRDAHGLPARFSLGDTPAFPPISISPKTAKLLVDALEQDAAEEICLQGLLGHPDKARLTRGTCAVSFSVLPHE